MDGAAFDFLEVDAVPCEGLKRGEKCAGAVGEAHGDGHLARVRDRRIGFGGAAEQEKTGEIFVVVLDSLGENDAAIMFGGAASGDARATFVAARDRFAHASGRVFRGNTLQVRMGRKKALALGQSHGVGSDRMEAAERRAGATDEVMFDAEDGLGGDREGAFEKQIVDADDGPGERIFDRGQEGVSPIFADGAKSGIERGARNGCDALAEKLDCGFFAESAGFTLKRNAHFMDDSIPRQRDGMRRSRRYCARGGIDPAWRAVRRQGAQNGAAERGGHGILRLGRRKMKLPRPEPGEYAAYYEKYISLVPGDDIAGALEMQRVHTMQLFAGRSEREGNFRYAPDKWTVKDVLGHVTDSERIFAYRALRIARGDKTPIEGFEQDDYVRGAGFNERMLANLVEEYADVRSATLALFRSFSNEAWLRRGTANKNEVSVRALAYMTAGHELHHRQILEERYFSAIPRA